MFALRTVLCVHRSTRPGVFRRHWTRDPLPSPIPRPQVQDKHDTHIHTQRIDVYVPNCAVHSSERQAGSVHTRPSARDLLPSPTLPHPRIHDKHHTHTHMHTLVASDQRFS